MSIIETPEVAVRFVAEVHDNWFSVRGPHGRLLMVGTYLPKAEPGITTELISAEAARNLLDELQQRTHAGSLVGTFAGEG